MMSPYGSTNDHGQCTELERPAAPDPIGDGAAEQAPNKGSAQADAHHESCTQQRHNLSNKKLTKNHHISSGDEPMVPSASVLPEKPRSAEMLSRGSLTTLRHHSHGTKRARL